MCTFPVQPICTFSCTAHFISLHILLLILFHYLFLISFSPYLYIYSLVFCFIVFIAFMLFLFYYYFLFFCTFHWADLSWLTFHYLLYPVWLCMWQIIKNLEPWTLKNLVWALGWEFGRPRSRDIDKRGMGRHMLDLTVSTLIDSHLEEMPL